MMSDICGKNKKKVAHEARLCVLLVFLPAKETHGNIHGTS